MQNNKYRAARIAAAMTQEHLAAASGVSVSTIRRIEKGEPISPESRRALASVLGFDSQEAIVIQEIRIVGEPAYERYFIRRPYRARAMAAHGIWLLMTIFAICVAATKYTWLDLLPRATSLWIFFATLSASMVLLCCMAFLVEGTRVGGKRQAVSSVMLALCGGVIVACFAFGFLSAQVHDLAFGCVVGGAVVMEILLLPVIRNSVTVRTDTKRLGGSFRRRYVKSALAGEMPMLAVAC